VDRDWPLFDLLVRASDSDGIGGIWDDAIQHKPELDGGQPTRGMRCELQGIAEFNRDRKPNHNIRCRDWSYAVDHL